MVDRIYTLPELTQWAQQLASILPFTALVEFIDIPSKLHVFELAGYVPLWNWPITPAGSRLLLSTLANSTTCCLDRVDRSAVLHCIDGRYGDCYPCSSPTTTRLAVVSADGTVTSNRATVLANNSVDVNNNSVRRQQLTVVVIDQEPEQQPRPPSRKNTAFNTARLRIQSRSRAYRAFSGCGWALLVFLAAGCLMTGLYVALVYLLLMPATGLVIQVTHGGEKRGLVDDGPSDHKRMVVCSSSFNADHWWVFYGGSRVVNSMLNKPLFRARPAPSSPCWAWLLQLLIAAQWITALASCALVDWNAIVISFWINLCAVTSAFLIRPEQCVRDWLRRDCHISTTQITTTFSSRRSMLGAMVYLNPDTKERRTAWMNPILAPCQERTDWESALLASIEPGKLRLTVFLFLTRDADSDTD